DFTQKFIDHQYRTKPSYTRIPKKGADCLRADQRLRLYQNPISQMAQVLCILLIEMVGEMTADQMLPKMTGSLSFPFAEIYRQAFYSHSSSNPVENRKDFFFLCFA